MLTVIEANPNRFLCGLTKVKARIQIAGTTHDGVLGALIIEATDRIERHCGRRFVAETVEERIAGSGALELLLERRPVAEIVSATLNGSAVDVSEIVISDGDAGIIYREAGFDATRGYDPGLIQGWPDGYQKRLDWIIQYTGGYACYPDPTAEAPEDEDEIEAPALPADLEGACEELVCILFDDRKRNTLRTSESEGDASTSYRDLQAWLNDRLKQWVAA